MIKKKKKSNFFRGYFSVVALQLKIEKTLKEKEELLKLIAVLEKETAQLREQVGRMEIELNHEKERCEHLQAEQKVSCVLCN
jgi:predicted nuclease with TOPRIM domain